MAIITSCQFGSSKTAIAPTQENVERIFKADKIKIMIQRRGALIDVKGSRNAYIKITKEGLNQYRIRSLDRELWLQPEFTVSADQFQELKEIFILLAVAHDPDKELIEGGKQDRHFHLKSDQHYMEIKPLTFQEHLLRIDNWPEGINSPKPIYRFK